MPGSGWLLPFMLQVLVRHQGGDAALHSLFRGLEKGFPWAKQTISAKLRP